MPAIGLPQVPQLWDNFRSAIVAAVPNVAITGPAGAAHLSFWTIPFGQTVRKRRIALLTQHHYRANGKSPSATAQYLITPGTNLVNELATLNTGAQEIGVSSAFPSATHSGVGACPE
ncbi:MAG: hypothetical protein AB7T14_08970 [Candidatus Methylacidiphilaceae bacterium]